MKNILIFALMVTFFGCSTSQKKNLDNTFYCFNNGVRTLPNAPETFDGQADLIKKVGFDGLAGHISEDYHKRRATLDEAGLKMPEIYWGMTLTDNGEITYKEGLKEVIKDSKDRDLVVTLFLNTDKYMDNKKKGNKLFARGIRELADFSEPYNTKIAIYPHANNYCETVEHSVELAQMVDRENAGVVFNTCHYLKVEGEEGWKEAIQQALPYLFMVSINGADAGNTKKMGWDRLIQPLGEGTFDTYELVKYLKDNGYEGLFGLQCYNINQDCELALTKSMSTWREYKLRYLQGD
ncbi:MAG: sugar phosphate isomerase/epimerase family protein [Bacteroidales bacterium]